MAFTIDDLSSVTAHFAADSITGLADDDPVSTWTCSKTSKTVTSSASARPLYKTNIVNGLPVLRFDGTDDVLASGSLFATNGIKNIGVCSVMKYDANKNYNGISAWAATSPATIHATRSYWADSGGNTYLYTATAFPRVAGSFVSGFNLALLVGGQQFVASRFNGLANGNGGNLPSSSMTADYYLTIGYMGLVNGYLDGDIAELVWFEETELQESIYIEGVLSHKYGISLATTHPFYAAAPTTGPGAGGGARQVNIRGGADQ